MTLAHFIRNPDFGTGCYRRLLRFYRLRHATLGTLDDTHHAMWLLLRHDDAVITDIEAAISRGPATSCPGSVPGLRELIGQPLGAESRALTSALTRTANCTHLSDLAVWTARATMKAAGPDSPDPTCYSISVADDDGAPFWVEIMRDGRPLHKWLVSGQDVIAPAALAGMPLMRGFMARALTHFEGDALEAAIMLQRGLFVSRGRRHIVDRTPVPLRHAQDMENACYSYSGDQWLSAENNIGYVRDFTDGVRPHPLPDHILHLLREQHQHQDP
ncbi:MAG: DUF2889 domain-containing protein [Sphingobium sp.]